MLRRRRAIEIESSQPVDARPSRRRLRRPPGSTPLHAAALLRYALRRAATALGTVAFVVVFNFFLFRLLPGNPVALYTRGRNVPAGAADRLREQCNQPFEQFWHYVKNPFDSTSGSLQFSRPVWDVIGDRVWPTLLLLGVSTILSTVIGVWIGIRGGWRRGSWFDRPRPASP